MHQPTPKLPERSSQGAHTYPIAGERLPSQPGERQWRLDLLPRSTEEVLTLGPTSFGSVARRERGTRSHAKSAAASARPPKNIRRRDPLSAFASRAEKTEPDRGPHVMDQACDAVGGEEWLPKGPTRQCHGRRTGARSALVWAEIKFVGPSKYNIFSFFLFKMQI